MGYLRGRRVEGLLGQVAHRNCLVQAEVVHLGGPETVKTETNLTFTFVTNTPACFK